MSSTNRGSARDTHIADYYRTPIDSIQLFWNEFNKHQFISPKVMILDPCAGGDAQHPMSYPTALLNIGCKIGGLDKNNIHTIDIREDSLADIKGDYLQMDCKDKYDIIITNPPFNIALDIIKKALNDVKDGGWVIMLLRLNFFEGKARKSFWEENMPVYSFVHSKRMAFSDSKSTDSVAYVHNAWKKGCNPEFTKLKII